MTTIEKSIDVAVPARAAYDQWSRYEQFPQFMSGVESVTRMDKSLLHWKTRIAGVEREFDAEVTEDPAGQRIAWSTVDGPRQAGAVTFQRLDDTHTKVMLQMDFEPDGLTEQIGDKLGVVSHQVTSDLERFKELVETQAPAAAPGNSEMPESAQNRIDLDEMPPPSRGLPPA